MAPQSTTIQHFALQIQLQYPTKAKENARISFDVAVAVILFHRVSNPNVMSENRTRMSLSLYLSFCRTFTH